MTHVTAAPWSFHHRTHAHNNITRVGIRQPYIDSCFGLVRPHQHHIADALGGEFF